MKFGEHEITIRRMRRTDAAAVAALDILCFACPWSVESFEYEAADNPLAYYLVAVTEDGSIAGYAGIWHILNEGHITNVAVRPDMRGRGLGDKIISELLTCSSVAGVVKFTLEVRVSNASAINVYKKFGFVEAGFRKSYYEDNGEDAIIMWKE
jgi:[ribosomal protein S18]-alanine N-acetyltransferase